MLPVPPPPCCTRLQQIIQDGDAFFQPTQQPLSMTIYPDGVIATDPLVTLSQKIILNLSSHDLFDFDNEGKGGGRAGGGGVVS